MVCVALIANGALDAWFSYQEQKRLLIAVQRVEADAAATKIGEFINQIEHQIGWLSLFPPEAVMPGDPRLDAIRLLRLEPGDRRDRAARSARARGDARLAQYEGRGRQRR